MNRSILVLAVFLSCFSAVATGEEMGSAVSGDVMDKDSGRTVNRNSGFYLGAGLAYNQLTACVKTATSSCTNTFTSYSQEAANLRLLGGYAFGKHFAIETELSGLGTFDVQDSSGNIAGEAKATTISVAAKGTITFPRGWSIFGKVGLASTRMQYSAKPGWILLMSSDQTSGGLLLGAGGQYDFNDLIGIRLWTDGATYDDDGYTGAIGGTSVEAIFKF